MVSPKYTTLICKGMLIHEQPQRSTFLKRRIAGGSKLEFEGGKRQVPVLIHDELWRNLFLTSEVQKREND